MSMCVGECAMSVCVGERAMSVCVGGAFLIIARVGWRKNHAMPVIGVGRKNHHNT